MNEYQFELTFKLPQGEDPDQYFELLEPSCSDAIVGTGQTGYMVFDFTREASSAYDAIVSAVTDVKKVIPEASLTEATPDFVGLTDVADLLGFTRQYMRKLMVNSGATFPSPIHEGKSSLWHLSNILHWLKENKKLEVEDTLIDVANINKKFNIMKELNQVNDGMQDNIRELIAS
jgi:predicted DNA-binding transcriptional regulator AlpA